MVCFCRGTFIVPSFDEIWPQAGKEKEKDKKRKAKRMGLDYILEVRARTTFKLVSLKNILKIRLFRQCNITAWATCLSLTILQPAVVLALRSNSTTTPSNAIQVNLLPKDVSSFTSWRNYDKEFKTKVVIKHLNWIYSWKAGCW
jgi:hypothetical protein